MKSTHAARACTVILLLLATLGAALGIPPPTPSPVAPPPSTSGLEVPGLPDPPPATSDPSSGTQQPPLRLDLQSVLEQAVRNSPQLLQALDKVRLAHWKISEAYIPVNPTLSVSTVYFRTLVQPPSGGGALVTFLNAVIPGGLGTQAPTSDNYQVTATLSQTVLTFGRVHWTALAARLSEKQARQDYRSAIDSLLLSVETAYAQALLGEANVAIAQERVDNRQSFVDLAKNLFRGGLVAEYDVLQYQSSTDQARLDLQTAVNNADKRKSDLLVMLGYAALRRVDLAPLGALAPPPASVDEGLAQALRTRAEIVSQLWSLQAAEANVRAAALASSPTLSLVSQYSGVNSSTGALTNQWVAGVSVNFPILDGGQARIQRKEAVVAVDQVRQSLESSKRTVEQDVAQAWLDLNTYWRQLDEAGQNVERARETQRIATLRYREGFSNSTEVLNAQESYSSAVQSHATVEYNYRLATFNWRRAIAAEWPIELPPTVRIDWEFPTAKASSAAPQNTSK